MTDRNETRREAWSSTRMMGWVLLASWAALSSLAALAAL